MLELPAVAPEVHGFNVVRLHGGGTEVVDERVPVFSGSAERGFVGVAGGQAAPHGVAADAAVLPDSLQPNGLDLWIVEAVEDHLVGDRLPLGEGADVRCRGVVHDVHRGCSRP